MPSSKPLSTRKLPTNPAGGAGKRERSPRSHSPDRGAVPPALRERPPTPDAADDEPVRVRLPGAPGERVVPAGLRGSAPEPYASGATGTYNRVMTSFATLCGNTGETHRLDNLLEEMRAQGHMPNRFTLTALVASYGRNDDIGAALEHFDNMAAYGSEPDLRAFNAALQACRNCGDAELAIPIFDAIVQAGLAPDSVSHATMISACANAGMAAEAIAYREAMVKAGFQRVTHDTIRDLARAHALAARTGLQGERREHARAAADLRRGMEHMTPPAPEALHLQTCMHAVAALEAADCTQEAEQDFYELLPQWREGRISPALADTLFAAVIAGCTAAGNARRAIDYAEKAEKLGLKGPEAGAALEGARTARRSAYRHRQYEPQAREASISPEMRTGSPDMEHGHAR
jgi:pentatricopeptide repeat protein